MLAVLVGDQYLVRIGREAIINDHFKNADVLQAKNLPGLLANYGHLRPDLIILIKTGTNPDLDFISASLVSGLKNRTIAIFNKIPEKSILVNYLNAGVSEFLSLEFDEQKIIESCQKILDKSLLIGQQRPIPRGSTTKVTKPGNNNILSVREQEIAYYLASGLRTSQISRLLGIKQSTTSTTKAKIFRKLRVENVIQLKDVIDYLARLRK